jgi:hypothetical protein
MRVLLVTWTDFRLEAAGAIARLRKLTAGSVNMMKGHEAAGLAD